MNAMKRKPFNSAWRPVEVREEQKQVQRRLLASAKLGDRAAVAELIQSHQWLVALMLRRSGLLVRDTMERDDLRSLGNVALLEAIRAFDLDRDCLFSTYATWHVLKVFSRELKRRRRHERMLPLAEDYAGQIPAPSPRQAPALPHGWRHLPRPWRKLLAMRFGLDGERARSAIDIAKEQGVTRAAVTNRIERALRFLRARVEPIAA